MSLNQIQNALKELNPGTFQKLGDCYIHHKGYRNINSLGSVLGADKTAKGTPDTFARQEDGFLIFAEYTTHQDGLFGKLQEDLAKCLDETKTGVPTSEIKEIIFCHNSRISPAQENELFQKGKEHGIKISIWGIETISFDLYGSFPGLARDFLGVPIDSGQIFTLEDFVATYDKNQFSTPLNTEFFFRDEEVKQALVYLGENNLVFLSGPAGVGKSRMALEVLKVFKESHSEYEVRCILNRGRELYDDLKVYFSGPGNFIIFVDDANRKSRFEYMVHLLLDQKDGQQFKILATVRDYALDKIKDVARPLGGTPDVQLDPFDQAQIKELIEKLFDITNSHWLGRIAEIAGGNPRIAIMAAKTATKESNLNSLNDVSTLYDHYFSTIREDLEQLNDENVLKIAGIICFFRTIDQSNEPLMAMIHNVFGFEKDTFWTAAQHLHEFELVDIYENDIVKISDQVLATYLFYLCVFRKKAIPFSILLENFFPGHIGRLGDSIYPCLNAFGFAQLSAQMQPVVKNKWEEYRNGGNDDGLRQLIETFGFMLETEALTHIRDSIESMPKETTSLDLIAWESSKDNDSPNSLLDLLDLFGQADEPTFRIALDLTFRYLTRRPSALAEGLAMVTEKFGFNRHSHLSGYSLQHIVVDVLIEQTEEGNNLLFSKLFIELAKKYVHTKFNSTEGNKKGITIHKFNLLAIPSIFELRKKIWECLFHLYDVPALQKDVLAVLRHYSKSGYYLDVFEIAEKDAELLFPFLNTKLDPEKFVNCLMVQDYLKFFNRRQIAGFKEIENRFNSATYQVYKLLALDYADKPDEMSFNDFQDYKRGLIGDHTQNFEFEDYKKLIDACLEIIEELGGSHERHDFASGIRQAFEVLSEKILFLFAEVIKYYLSLKDPLNGLLRPYPVVAKLIEGYGPEKAWEIFEEPEYSSKKQWEFCYFQVLKTEQVNLQYLESLYGLYHEAELFEMPHDFDYLLKFRPIDSNVIVNVVTILIGRTESDVRFAQSLGGLFMPHGEISKNFAPLFENALEVLKKAYFLYDKASQNSDFDGHIMNLILDLDPNFINDHIDKLYKEKDHPSRYDDQRDYNFLWKRDDAEVIMVSVIKRILINEKERDSLKGSIVECLFCVNDRRASPAENIVKQDQFLSDLIKENYNDLDMMTIIFTGIAYFKPERRKEFVSTFLNNNKKFSDFENLPLEPDTWGWSGSAVPMISGRIDYWQSLLPLVNSVGLLDHRKLIETRIQGLQRYIEDEKKSDFIKD